MDRIILHCDMDRFYCTVEEKHNPELRNVPFAVCGDPEMRHSIVMSANALARERGVRAGLRFSDARRLCRNLQYVTADYDKYLVETKAAREIYQKYSDKIIPYGLDENWIIMDDNVSWREAKQIADVIRLEIMYSMNLSASIGISDNLIFSKLGSDYQKPNGQTVITKKNYKKIVWPMDIQKLLFVGDVRRNMLYGYNIKTIGDIARTNPKFLAKILSSRVGHDLWRFANGDDRNFRPECEKINSIGNTITPPRDLKDIDEVAAIIYMLTTAVCIRLRKHKLRTRCVSINMKDSKFNSTVRQTTITTLTDNKSRIYDCALRLFKENYTWVNPLRSIGIRVTNLEDNSQLSLFCDYDNDNSDIVVDDRIKHFVTKFSALEVESMGALGRWD